MRDSSRVPAPAPVGSKAIAMTPIRIARESQGLTQAEVASRTGIDPAHFQMIEEMSDVAAPSLKGLEQIAEVLSLRLEDIR